MVLTVLVLFLFLERRRATKRACTQSLLPITHNNIHPSTPLTHSKSPSHERLTEMKLKYNGAYATKLEASGDSPGLDSISGCQQGEEANVPLPSAIGHQSITACRTKNSSMPPSTLHVELKLNECYSLETSAEDLGKNTVHDSLNIPQKRKERSVTPTSVGGLQFVPPIPSSPLLYAEITDYDSLEETMGKGDIAHGDYDGLDETTEGEEVAPPLLLPIPAKERWPTKQLDVSLISPSHMTKHHGDIKPSNKKANLADTSGNVATIIYDHLREGENVTALQQDAEECQYDYDYVIET